MPDKYENSYARHDGFINYTVYSNRLKYDSIDSQCFFKSTLQKSVLHKVTLTTQELLDNL